MIKMLTILSLVSISLSAFADYNTAAIRGQIRCTGKKGLSVVINSERTAFTVTMKEQAPQKIDIYKETETDGDTFVTYTGTYNLVHYPNLASLSLDDQGDNLQMPGRAPISLTCPE